VSQKRKQLKITMDNIIEEVDQRDIQKRGNLFAKYPISYPIMRIMGKYNIRNVLDVTYGKGRFYKLYRPKYLVGVDPVKRKWIVRPDEFYQMTVYHFYRLLKNSEITIKPIDCIVIDPPWAREDRKYREEFNYVIGTPELIVEYGKKVAELVKAPYMLLHHNQQPPLGRIIYIIKFKWVVFYHPDTGKESFYILYQVR
jgi:hypothetical protein